MCNRFQCKLFLCNFYRFSDFGQSVFFKLTRKLTIDANYRLSGHGADLEKVKTIGSAEGDRYRVDLSHQ